MAASIVATVPESFEVRTSKAQARVILKIEVLVPGEDPDDRRALQNYQLDPYDAISLGRLLQDQSMSLLLSLAGWDVPPGIFPKTDERPH